MRVLQYLQAHLASLLSIGVRGLTVLAGFGIAFLIGRAYGPEANGYYALITQTAMFLSILAVGGLDLAVVKDFSAAHALKKMPCRGSVLRLFLAVFAICAAVSAVIWLFGAWFFERFQGISATPEAMLFLSLIFLSRTFTRLTSAFLRSQRLYVFSQIVEGLLIPIPVLIAIAFGWATGVKEILAASAIAGLFALMFGVVASFTRTRKIGDLLAVKITGTFAIALPLWGVAIAKNFGDWYALMIVSSNLSVADAGLFRIASQAASALPIITIGIFGVFSPQIGAAVAAKNPAGIAKLGRSATMLSIILVLPVATVLFASAELLLGFIGPEFIAATRTLQLLIAGQALYVATGPSGLTLAMTGHQRVNLVLSVFFLAILLVSVPLALQVAGLEGAAIAISVVLIGQNITSFFAVRNLVGINLLTGSYNPPSSRGESAL